MKKKSLAKLKIIPLGGLGEVGLNFMAIAYGDQYLLVDCGVLFPDLFSLGLDLVIPDFTFLEANKDKIVGLVVTHGHEDHIGAIPFLLQKFKIPKIACSKFVKLLLGDKFSEYSVDFDQFQIVAAGDRVVMEDFDVEFIHVTHSTVESFALAIRTPAGMVIHSGDFKFDEKPYQGPPSDKTRLKALRKEKPLLLLSDSTNSERSGCSESEASISEDLTQLIRDSKGLTVVALFASNINRIKQLFDISDKLDKYVVLSGRSMGRYFQVGLDCGYLPVNLERLKTFDQIKKLPREKIVILSTGSQGEARSSLLRLAKNENPHVQIQKGDTVILSSRNIPGNETAINFVVNKLFKLGADVHYEDLKNIHVSGHAYQEEQKELIELVRPRYFIPIHGEYRHLAKHQSTASSHKALKDGTFLLENGMVWSFDPEVDKAEIESQGVTVGKCWYFHGHTGTFLEKSILQRKAAGRAGVIVISCTVETRTKFLKRKPEVDLAGFLCQDEKQERIKKEISSKAAELFEEWKVKKPEEFGHEELVAQAGRRIARKWFDIKPLVIVRFIEE